MLVSIISDSTYTILMHKKKNTHLMFNKDLLGAVKQLFDIYNLI